MASEFGLPGISDLSLIGRGGFGAVYRGHQEALGREVAVKILNAPGFDDVTQRRFEREQRTLGALSQHPSIVTLYETGVTETGSPYLVMELMEGGSLSQRLAESGALPWAEAVRIMIPIADAAAEAHRRGVLHRDIKPDNILISPYGEPKLGDFGIASLADATGTVTTTVTATVEHAAPEIIDGQAPSPASDIYSLGSTLHTLVAGISPFRHGPDDTTLAIMRRVGDDPPPTLTDIPDALASLLAECLAKEPDQRTESAEALATRLRALLEEHGHKATAVTPTAGVAAASAAAGPAPTRAIRRQLDPEPAEPNRRRLVALLGVIFGLLLITLIAFAAIRPDSGQVAATTPTDNANSTSTTTTAIGVAAESTTTDQGQAEPESTTTSALTATTSSQSTAGGGATATNTAATTDTTATTTNTTTTTTTTTTAATTTTMVAATTTTTAPATFTAWVSPSSQQFLPDDANCGTGNHSAFVSFGIANGVPGGWYKWYIQHAGWQHWSIDHNINLDANGSWANSNYMICSGNSDPGTYHLQFTEWIGPDYRDVEKTFSVTAPPFCDDAIENGTAISVAPTTGNDSTAFVITVWGIDPRPGDHVTVKVVNGPNQVTLFDELVTDCDGTIQVTYVHKNHQMGGPGTFTARALEEGNSWVSTTFEVSY